MNTAKYIGPDGINGKYATNHISCGNCHQDGGLKPHSFDLVHSFANYPQYRAREGKVLSLAERVNNCMHRPLNGRSLPLDSKEMIAFLSYMRWINNTWGHDKRFSTEAKHALVLTDTPASPQRGSFLFSANCARCHGENGQGLMSTDNINYIYPPLWGSNSFQAGSSMHRVVKLAKWLKLNMPYGLAMPGKPHLTDQQALDIAAFINDDEIHKRPQSKRTADYPNLNTKPIDYTEGPFADTFSIQMHKYGPYPKMIEILEAQGGKVIF